MATLVTSIFSHLEISSNALLTLLFNCRLISLTHKNDEWMVTSSFPDGRSLPTVSRIHLSGQLFNDSEAHCYIGPKFKPRYSYRATALGSEYDSERRAWTEGQSLGRFSRSNVR
jgi:hypothetical protein